MKTIMVTGADRGLGYALCKKLLEDNFRVIAGQYMEEWKELDILKHEYGDKLFLVRLDIGDMNIVRAAAEEAEEYTDSIDILINCAGIDGEIRDIRDGYDYHTMLRTIDVNALGAIRMTEAFLPLLDKGTDKKICCVSSEAGSIGNCWRIDETGYCMSKAALNVGMAVLYNRLRPEGYDIRLYHPGWMNTYMMGAREEHADLEPEKAAELALNSFFRERKEESLLLESYDGSVIPW